MAGANRSLRCSLAVLALLSAALALPACAHLGRDPSAAASQMTPEQLRRVEDCRYYDDAYLAWGVVGKVGAACATAATTSGAFVEGFADEEDAADWSLGLFVTGGVCGLAALGGSWMSGEYAERHSRYCSEPEPTPFVGEVEMPPPFASLTPEEDAVTVEMPLVPAPSPALDVPPGETGTGSDGLADDEPLEPPGEEVP